MQKKKKFFFRYFMLLAVFIFAASVYSGALLNMQIANAGIYRRRIPTSYTRTFIVPAVRGEIFDRNGTPLVTNRNIYDIVIDGTKMPRRGYIEILIDLIGKIKRYGGEITGDSLPVISISASTGTGTGDGGTRYSYTTVLQTSTQARNRLDKFLTANKLSANTSANELVEYLTNKYSLDTLLPPEERDADFFRTVLGVCYDFDRQNVLLGDYEYKISADVNGALAAAIKENSHNYPGVELRLGYERVYHFPTVAPHIMGRIGSITDTQLNYYLSKGYARDAIVGRSGAELAFEEYLRGIDGIIERTYDQDNNLIGEQYIKEPVAGKNVYLTIDIKLQQVAEYSIAQTIGRIHDLAYKHYPSDPKNNGADAFAGAAAVTDPNTGQVLALATYPSYDMSEWGEKYNEWAADTVNNPLMNRAVTGEYAPGSVFKIVTSLAALDSGNLTTAEKIYDPGKYTVYDDYQPVCWSYTLRGYGHGYLNVTQALSESCNCFYFALGDRLGISTLNEYSKRFGLGEATGIEIGETKGILASPEYVNSIDKAWTDGQTIQAAIGQSYNAFSPLQMANMLGTVINGGHRYRCTLLLRVEEYGAGPGDIYYAQEPEIIETISLSPNHLNAVLQGMKSVMETGTASALFNSFPRSIPVGGKTGTAEVSGPGSDNATFVAFAPYNDPQVSMSVCINKGAKGTWAGYVAEDVLAYYFGLRTFEEATGLPPLEAAEPGGE